MKSDLLRKAAESVSEEGEMAGITFFHVITTKRTSM